MSTYSSSPRVPSDQRSAAVIAHLSAPIAAVVSAGWLPFLGPLIIWFVYKDRSPFVRRQAADAFNFNLWITVISVIAWILAFTVIGLVIAIPLWIIAGVLMVWCSIHGAIRSSKGEPYSYPFRIRVLS